MKQIIKDSLSSDKKTISTMRLMSYIIIATAIIIALALTVLSFIHPSQAYNSIRELSILILGMLGIAFGGKALQKFAEREGKNGN